MRAALTPASWAYAAGWDCYAGLYRLRIKRAFKPCVPVICVGNYTVGGSGKTPLTMYLARAIQRFGRDVAISASGYGSPASRDATRAPEGDLSALNWGDEPALTRWLLPDVPLIVGRDRVKAAQICALAYPDSVLIMDDGFQHLPLEKSLSIVIDPSLPNRRCLPAGPYRQPRDGFPRPDIVLPGEFMLAPEPLKLVDSRKGTSTDAPSEANVLCAIGNPSVFIQSLSSLKTELKERRLLPDHDTLQGGNLFSDLPPTMPLIVTEKDWVKLRERRDLDGRRILIARYSIAVQPEESFNLWLRERLDANR